MADAAELNKIQETLDYFNRYYEFDSALKVLRENRQYLETYIRDKHYVEDKFDAYGKSRKSMLLGIIVAVVGALIVLLATGFKFEVAHIVIAAVVAAVCWCGVFFVTKILISKKIGQLWDEQQKVNEGIAAQIEDVTKRCENLENQKNGYLAALDEKKLVVIPSKYIIEAQKIASYVKEGKAETAQQAVEMFENEQNRLKERALAERKRREEEAAAAKALNIERERQRAIREQREAELRKVAEEERLRANVTPASDTATSEPEEGSRQRSGLSLAMGGGKKSAPAAKESSAAAETKSSGLSLAGKSSKKSSDVAAAKPQEPVEHRTVESVMHGGEMSSFGGNGLALASSNKKTQQRRTPIAKPAEEKSHKAYEPIRLVDEPDDVPQDVDEETLDIQARMQSLLTANKPVLKRHAPISHEKQEELEARVEMQIDSEQEAAKPEAAPQPIAEEIPAPEEQPATVAEVVAEEPAQPEEVTAPESEVSAEPEALEGPTESAEPAEAVGSETPAEPEEEPKHPFSGLAMKKK